MPVRELIDVGFNGIDGALCAVYLLENQDTGAYRYLVAYDDKSEIFSDYVDVLENLGEKGYQL